jgi:hypothetical protein
MSRRRRTLVALGLASAAALVVVILGGRAAGTRGAPPAPAPAAPAAPLAAASAPTPAPRAPDPPLADDPVTDRGGRGAIPAGGLARAAADDYRRRARFPRSSHPLAPEEGDPLVRDRTITPITSRGPNGEDPALTVFPALAGFEAPEPAVLYAYLSVGETMIVARDVRAIVLTDDLTPVAEVVYRDDGIAPDGAADDRLYTATFSPDAEAARALARSYMVRVTAVTPADDLRFAATSFLYSAPHAQLTGSYRDAMVDGSLSIEAEVEVTQAGRFHLEGSLYTADGGRGLAWAQNAIDLPPGRHWIPLSYYGLAFREAGVDGPYLLRYVALSTATAMPNGKNRLMENAHVTRAYRASAFTERSFDDPSMLEAAERVERDLAGGLPGLDAGG